MGPAARLASVLCRRPFPRFDPALVPQAWEAGAGFGPLLYDPVEIMVPLWALVSLICIPESWVWAVWIEVGGGNGGILQERETVAGSRQ